MFKILIVEDEFHLRQILSESLSNAGYTIAEAFDGVDALSKFTDRHFDLVITDVMMPRKDGYELVKEIRKINNDIPILILTALGDMNDKEKWFKNGTDDYLVKPVAIKELLMQVKALLRRYKIVYENRIELSETEMSYNTNVVKIKGQKVELTKKEFLLLYRLLSNPDTIFTREQLLNEIWGYDSESADRTIDTHISLLREKAQCEDFEIVTVRGLGYKAVLHEKT